MPPLCSKVIINLYAETHMDMLLPTLESGVTNTNWRIRDCSVALLGDFLYQVRPVWGCFDCGQMSASARGKWVDGLEKKFR